MEKSGIVVLRQSVGLAIKRSQVRVSAGHHGVKTQGNFSHLYVFLLPISITWQVPVKGRLPFATGEYRHYGPCVGGMQEKTVWSPCDTRPCLTFVAVLRDILSGLSFLSCVTASL